MSGFVSFVGSGPGDPELLTVKAVDRLRRADVILFDDLSSGPILSHAASSCELVAVGKRAGRLSPKQHHVSDTLDAHFSCCLGIPEMRLGRPTLRRQHPQRCLVPRSQCH